VKIEKVFVHCSASRWGNSLVIDEWHKARGFDKIGYHFVISNGLYQGNQKTRFSFANGSIEAGRSVDSIGAHTVGFNQNSLGICLIGDKVFTKEQIETLYNMIVALKNQLGTFTFSNVHGHYEAGLLNPKFAVQKTCPNMPMDKFRLVLENKLSIDDFLIAQVAYAKNL